MVHGTKNKVDYNLQRKFFHQEKHIKVPCYRPRSGFEPELPIYKEDIKAEKSGVVTGLTIEDLQNCKTGWRTTR
jgi:hypothetical protein